MATGQMHPQILSALDMIAGRRPFEIGDFAHAIQLTWHAESGEPKMTAAFALLQHLVVNWNSLFHAHGKAFLKELELLMPLLTGRDLGRSQQRPRAMRRLSADSLFGAYLAVLSIFVAEFGDAEMLNAETAKGLAAMRVNFDTDAKHKLKILQMGAWLRIGATQNALDILYALRSDRGLPSQQYRLFVGFPANAYLSTDAMPVLAVEKQIDLERILAAAITARGSSSENWALQLQNLLLQIGSLPNGFELLADPETDWLWNEDQPNAYWPVVHQLLFEGRNALAAHIATMTDDNQATMREQLSRWMSSLPKTSFAVKLVQHIAG